MLGAFGSFIGFALLAGLAVIILAAVVLLPAYAKMEQVRYQRDLLACRYKDAQKLVAGHERMLKALEVDETLTKRLASEHFAVETPGEVVVADPKNPPQTTEVKLFSPTQPPPPPDNWLIRAADKIQNVRTKRGMILLAAGAMLTAMFLFSPPNRYRKEE